MRNLFTSLLLLTSMITVQAQTKRIIATNDMTAREIINKNAYIEFSSKDSIKSNLPSITICEDGSLSWDDKITGKQPRLNVLDEIFEAFRQVDALSKMRAARYRFHQKLVYDETGHFCCMAQTAEELNISEKLFNRFKREMEEENKSLDEKRKNSNGRKVYIHANNNYLEQLLIEPKDFSKLEIKDNGFTAREIVEKNIFIPYTMEELRAKSYENEYEETISYVHPAYRAALYRFYKNVEQNEDGTCTWTTKNGAELNISEDLFNKFANETKETNEFILENKLKGINTHTPLYDEKYFNELLDDEHAKNLLEQKQIIIYLPRFNRVEIK